MSKTELRTVLSPDAASAARFASSSKPQWISKTEFEKMAPGGHLRHLPDRRSAWSRMMMRIRSYNDGDGPAVRALFIRINRELAPDGMGAEFETYIAQSLREEIGRIPVYYAERGGSFWVAEDAGVIIGMYGLKRVDPRSAELRRMYVAPEARRRGIARALLDHAERHCRRAGLDALKLSTSEVQTSALALYRAAGFQFTREEIASTPTNKTVGSGLRRFHFEKKLTASLRGPEAGPNSATTHGPRHETETGSLETPCAGKMPCDQ